LVVSFVTAFWHHLNTVYASVQVAPVSLYIVDSPLPNMLECRLENAERKLVADKSKGVVVTPP